MDHVRLIGALIATALAACGPADAQTSAASSGVVVPAGWQPLPQLATAARDAIASKTTVDGVEAWGETARGCYALWISLSASGSATQLADQVLAALANVPGPDGKPRTNPAAPVGSTQPGADRNDAGVAATPSRIDVRDAVKPSVDPGVLTLAFERAPYRGRLVARLGGGKIVALACFANEREPVACEAACTPMLGVVQ